MCNNNKHVCLYFPTNSVDPPGPARLEFDPLIVVKGQALNMRCIVDEEGRPAARTYRWMRGNYVQTDVHSSNWTIYPVSLETRANFSCEALNPAGQGPPATLLMEVFGNPFIALFLRFSTHSKSLGFIGL